MPEQPVLAREARALEVRSVRTSGFRDRRDDLEYYLDEFTFRFNRRTSRHRGKLFCRLLQQAVSVEPVPFSRLVAPRGHHG